MGKFALMNVEYVIISSQNSSSHYFTMSGLYVKLRLVKHVNQWGCKTGLHYVW